MEKENDKQTEPENNVESIKNSDFKMEEDPKNEADEIDPFYFKRNTGCSNLIQIIAMTPIALIRLICIIFLLLMAWFIARYGIKLNVNNNNFWTQSFKQKFH